MNELDLLRDWPTEEVLPSAEVRAHALAELERQFLANPVVPTRRARPARQFAKRLAIAGLAAVVLMVGAIVWAERAVDDRIDRIKTVAIPKDVLGAGEIGKAPVNILVVGSDRRDGTNVEAFGSPADTGPPRSDTIILLRIDGTSVRGMWIPRDLLVGAAPGVQVNATFNRGPQGLIEALTAEFDLAIDHYVEIDFGGFSKIVDAIGGVTLFSPGPVRDVFSGLDLPARGCIELNGMQALQWVRARHVELFDNGQWVDASPRADLDRLARQQDFVSALARGAKAKIGDDPIAAVRLADAIVPALVVDAGFSNAEVRGLVGILARVNPAELALATLPVRESANEAGRVEMAQPEAGQALAPFRGEAPVAAPPSGAAVGPSAPPAPTC
jgi:LCP family protein required for cell wall assembly